VDEVDEGGCGMDREHAPIGIISEMVAPISVMNLQEPPLAQANREKIDTLKRRTQEIAHDLRSRDDIQISYLEMLEECDNDNLRLAHVTLR
jgi:hypothetical protein